jgi:hypothetical protein
MISSGIQPANKILGGTNLKSGMSKISNSNGQKSQKILGVRQPYDTNSMSCTISTVNNSGKFLPTSNSFYLAMASKALESKHPKFMKTIEEVGVYNVQKTPSSAFPYMQVDLKAHHLKVKSAHGTAKVRSSNSGGSSSIGQYKSPTYAN